MLASTGRFASCAGVRSALGCAEAQQRHPWLDLARPSTVSCSPSDVSARRLDSSPWLQVSRCLEAAAAKATTGWLEQTRV